MASGAAMLRIAVLGWDWAQRLRPLLSISSLRVTNSNLDCDGARDQQLQARPSSASGRASIVDGDQDRQARGATTANK